MKKIIVILVSIFLIIGITIIGIKVLNKPDEDFPHFKQACLKFNGTSYGFVGKSFDLSFHFLDENEVSEMSDISNIVEMKIIDDKNRVKIVNINKMTSRSLNLSYTEDDYFIKNIYTSTTFDEEGLYTLKQVEIKYIDGSFETFDVGELNIVMENEDSRNYSEYLGYCTQDVVTSDMEDRKYCMISSILISLSSYSKLPNVNAKIIDIDLGLNGIDTDYENIEIKDKKIDDELINYYLQNKKTIKYVDKLDYKDIPFDLSFNDGETKTLIVPVISEKIEKEPTIYIITPKVTVEVDNQIYVLHYKQNQVVTPMVSVEEKNGGMNVVNYIEEYGI